MSRGQSHPEMPFRRMQSVAVLLGVVCLAIAGVGGWFNPTRFFSTYLAAYQFYLGLALGSLALVMVYHLTGGAWGFLIRRILEAAMRTLPLLVVLFLPLACGLDYLFDWARPTEVAASPGLQHKQLYLNPTFFLIRAAIYFVGWTGLMVVLATWSRRQDRAEEPDLPSHLGTLSGLGLVFYGVSIHFASVDWLLALQPEFRSTIAGPLYASGQVLSAHALALVVLCYLAPASPLGSFRSPDLLNDLGNLLLTFVIIWAYLVYFQFMLIWIADIPHEVLWYLTRWGTGWQVVVWGLVIFHLVLPFFLLLSRDIKRQLNRLAAVAILILVSHLVYTWYWILPVFPVSSVLEYWLDPLVVVGLGGVWLGVFLWQLSRYPLVVAHDLNRESALHLRRRDEVTAAGLQEV